MTERRRAGATASMRVAAFAVTSVMMTFPNVSQWTTRLPGNSGDALFNYWAIRWAASRFPHAFTGYWSAPIYAGNPRTAAYSDTHLGVAPIQWLLEHLLRSPVLAFNLILLALWTVSSEATYRLARRFGVAPGAAVIGAFIYTFATIRLGQYGHPQLTAGGLIPLLLLCGLRTLDTRRKRDAVATGVVFSVLTMSASYYGLLMALALGVIAVIVVVHRRATWREFVVPLVVAALAAGVLTGPVAWQYVELQRNPAFRRTYDPAFALHTSDFVHVVGDNRLLGTAPILRSTDPKRSGENFAFPGLLAIAAVPIGLAIILRRRWWTRERLTKRVEIAAIAAAGVISVWLAFGRELTILGWHFPAIYRVLHHLPAFGGIRALVRLTVLFQLALALLAAAGVHVVLRRVPKRVAALALASLLAVFVLVETSVRIRMVIVPTIASGDANDVLRHRAAGVVVELPMPDPSQGAVWPYTEAPRMAVAIDDGHPRLNGYSGFWSPGYPEIADTLARLPDPEADAALCENHVRYVVLRTRSVAAGVPSIERLVSDQGEGALSEGQATRIAAGLAHRVAVTRVDGAILVELDPAC